MMPLVIESALRSAALGLAALVVLKALGIRNLHTEKLLWTMVTAVSLAMPVLMHAMALPPTAPIALRIPGGDAAAGLLDDARYPTLAALLSGIYLCVTGILLLGFLVRLFRGFRLYRRAQKPTVDILRVDLRVSAEIRCPCTFASSILVPTEFDSWGPTLRRAALAHERAHVVQLDCYRLWLATLYSCVFWFSPVPWLIRRRLVLLAELTSDQEALRCVEDATAYAEILVQLAANARPLEAAVAMSGRTHLTRRIQHIMESNMISQPLSLGHKIAFTAASLMASVMCISCASGPHVLSQAEDSKVSWVSGAGMSQFYPAELRKQRVEGDVVVKLAVDPAGRVTDANVVTERPAGSGLGAAAVRAAQTFQFNNTLAKPVIKTIDVKFALAD
jgi:TonB family protein